MILDDFLRSESLHIVANIRIQRWVTILIDNIAIKN